MNESNIVYISDRLKNSKSKSRLIRIGSFTILLAHRDCPDVGLYVKWRPNAKWEVTVYWDNPNKLFAKYTQGPLGRAQGRTVRLAMRQATTKIRRDAFKYACMNNDVDSQVKFLQRMARFHMLWGRKHHERYHSRKEDKDRRYSEASFAKATEINAAIFTLCQTKVLDER